MLGLAHDDEQRWFYYPERVTGAGGWWREKHGGIGQMRFSPRKFTWDMKKQCIFSFQKKYGISQTSSMGV
jgi:hypothetical protein